MVWDSAMSYLSKNGGDSWTLLKPAALPYLRWLAFGPTYGADGAIWRQQFDSPIGMEVTKDGGATWQPLGSAPSTPVTALGGPPAPGRAPWAGTPYGLIEWTGPKEARCLREFRHGWGTSHLNLALSPAFATDSTAIAESAMTKDAGATWQPLPFASEIESAIGASGSSQAAAFSPNYAADGVALVGFDDWPSDPVSQLRRTADRGATWQSGSLPVGSVRAIVFDPAGQRVYAGGEGGVAVSNDAGATWQNAGGPLSLLSVRGLVMRQEGGASALYAATTSAGMWRSAEGGVTWTKFNVGLSDGYLCAAAGNDALLATATCAGQVYLLGEGGGWERAGSRISALPSDLLVEGALVDGRLWLATNDGAWSATLPPGEPVKLWLPTIER
jgi:hypothetical protein